MQGTVDNETQSAPFVGEEGADACRLETVTPLQQDVLQELVNIGMGRAAGALNQMTRSHVELQAPSVRMVRLPTLKRFACRLGDMPLDIVKLRFRGGFSGTSCLFFAREGGTMLVPLMFGNGSAPADIDVYRADTLKEVGNIVLIWIMGAIGQAIGCSFEYKPLEYLESLTPLMEQAPAAGRGLVIKATFRLRETVIQGDILMLFDGEDCQSLIRSVDRLAQGAG